MSEETKKPIDEKFMEQAAAISMEWFDITPLALALAEQYKLGFDAGAKLHAIDQEDLKVAFQRGRDSYRDELLTRMDLVPKTANGAELDRLAQQPITHDQNHKPIASGIEEIQTPSEPEPDPPKVQSRDRPDGIPENFDMCSMILKDAGEPLMPREILSRVSRRWWPNIPGDWTGCVFGFVNSGKLTKDEDGKISLAEKPAPSPLPKSAVRKDPQAVINREADRRALLPTPPRREVVTPGAKLGPPARGEGVPFVHRDHAVTLHQREVEIMVRLRAAMGSGHLDAKFLAGSIGIKSDAEATMKDFVSILNGKIAAIGLQIDFFKGYGFVMKEVA